MGLNLFEALNGRVLRLYYPESRVLHPTLLFFIPIPDQPMHGFIVKKTVWIGLLACILPLAACSSSKPAVNVDPVDMPEDLIEVFDPSPYADTPPPTEVEITHDVPAALMDGSRIETETRAPRRMPGYRIQVFSSLDRQQADQALQQALVWWTNRAEDPNDHAPVYLEYEQPRYKVRIGDYTSRDEATELLYPARDMFPSAFIVPSMIVK